jgi:hypothetical protein
MGGMKMRGGEDSKTKDREKIDGKVFLFFSLQAASEGAGQ